MTLTPINLPILPSLKKGLSKTLNLLAKKGGLFLLVLWLVDLILGGLIFYHYDFLKQKKAIILPTSIPLFKKDLYQEVIRLREERVERFREIELKTYPDLFRESHLD